MNGMKKNFFLGVLMECYQWNTRNFFLKVLNGFEIIFLICVDVYKSQSDVTLVF